MKPRALLRAAAPVALVVATSSPASDCQSVRSEDSRARYSSKVEIRSDDNTCWRVTLDGRRHSGCGDATFYRHEKSGSGDQVRVIKVRGGSAVRASLVVDGRTVDRGTARSKGQQVVVRQDVRAG